MPLLPRQVAAAFILAAACHGAAAQEAGPAFAVVDGAVISVAQFEAALQNTVRQKFFHRDVPEARLREFEREVAQTLIERALAVAEGRRRGLGADREGIDRIVADYDARYAQSAAWQEKREALIASLRDELEERQILAQLRSAMHAVGEPPEDELRAYYERNPGFFTEPERTRVAALVVKVSPAATKAQWEAAETQADAARRRMLASGDFSELKDHGYLHQGMLPQAIAARLAAMAPGELAEPIRILEGFALVRLAERTPARAQSFDEARARAVQLWQRDAGARRWQALVDSLRRAATIRIDVARYPALSGIAP